MQDLWTKLLVCFNDKDEETFEIIFQEADNKQVFSTAEERLEVIKDFFFTAAQQGYESFVRLLLCFDENVAECRQSRSSSMTGFLYAVKNDHVLTAHAIWSRCPAVIDQKNHGKNALQYASNRHMASMVLHYKPNLMVEANKCQIPFLFDVMFSSSIQMFQECVEFCATNYPMLLETIKCYNGYTLLEEAHRNELVPQLKILFKTKPDIKAPHVNDSWNQNTTLHIAMLTKDIKIISDVFNHCYKDLYCLNCFGKTPFHLALESRETFNIAKWWWPKIDIDTQVELDQKCKEICQKDIRKELHNNVQMSTKLLSDIVQTICSYFFTTEKKHTTSLKRIRKESEEE